MNRLSFRMVTDRFVSLLMIAFFIEMLTLCGFSLGCCQHYLFVEQNSQINTDIRLSLLLQRTCVYPLTFIFKRKTKGVCVYFNCNWTVTIPLIAICTTVVVLLVTYTRESEKSRKFSSVLFL